LVMQPKREQVGSPLTRRKVHNDETLSPNMAVVIIVLVLLAMFLTV
jgi:hypothetical protein